MTDLARAARDAILLWEMNPKRQALAKILGRPASEITDEMIRRTETGAGSFRGPNMQQYPRSRKP